MTDARAALVEKIAKASLALAQKRAIESGHDIHLVLSDMARLDREHASLALDTALEEAARVVRRMPSPSSEWMADELLRALGGPANQVPEDIRALKSSTGDTP